MRCTGFKSTSAGPDPIGGRPRRRFFRTPTSFSFSATSVASASRSSSVGVRPLRVRRVVGSVGHVLPGSRWKQVVERGAQMHGMDHKFGRARHFGSTGDLSPDRGVQHHTLHGARSDMGGVPWWVSRVVSLSRVRV